MDRMEISPALAARIFCYAVENPVSQEWVAHFGWSKSRTHVGRCMQLMQPDSYVPNFVSFSPRRPTIRRFIACLAGLYKHESWMYFNAEHYIYWLGMFTHEQQDLIVHLLAAEIRRQETGVSHV